MPFDSFIPSWFAKFHPFFTPARQSAPPNRPKPRRRHAIEHLESRTLFQAVSWASATSGDWDDPTNWSNNAVPTAADDVTIDMPGVTVTHSTGTDAANSVTSTDPILLTGGTLSIALNLNLGNTFTLAGGLLDNATVTGTPNDFQGSSAGGILNNITFNVDMLIPDGATVTVENNLALNGGNMNLAGASANTQLNFINSGPDGIEGNGIILMGGAAPQFDSIFVDDNSGGLSISSTNGIQGGGSITTVGNGGTFEMDGNLISNLPGSSLTLSGPNWDNEGSFEALNTATLNINTTLTGEGTIVETNSTLNLGGVYMTTSVVQRTGGVVNLTGTLTSDGGTEAFDLTTGPWNLVGGVVSNCTLIFVMGNSLVPSSSGGTLSNVTLGSDLTVPDGASLTVTNGLILNANLTVASDTTATTLNFLVGANMTVDGTGQIILAGSSPGLNSIFFNALNGSLTFTASVTIQGSGGTIAVDNSGGDISFFGTLSANTAGQTITLTGDTMDLQGTAQAINGGTLNVDNVLSIEGSLTETNSTLNLGFTLSNSSQMSHVVRSGGTVNLTGGLDFFGLTATFTTATGSWNLVGGMVANMSLAFTGGNTLIPTSAGGTFSNVILQNDLDVPAGAILTVDNGLVLAGAQVVVDSTAQLDFHNSPAQSIGGTGTISLNGGAVNSIDFATGLSIGPGITIDGEGTFNAGPSDVLEGIISADASQPLQLAFAPFDNEGIIQAINGGVLNVGVAFPASTVFNEINSTINFSGFLLGLPIVMRTGGTLNIAGTFLLTGTQVFDDTTGPWTFTGTIADGALTFTGTGALTPEGQNATLQGVTLNSDLTVPDGVNLNITEGLTLNNATITIASTQSPATLTFANDSSQAISGTGQIEFAGVNAVTNDSIDVDDSMGSLTVTAGITIGGTSGAIQTFGAGGNLILQGVVSADSVNGTIILLGPNIVYQGTLQAIGGTLVIDGDFQAPHTGFVNIMLGNGVDGQFIITGNAAFDGTLNLLTGNGFSAGVGSVFDLISFAAATGDFSTINGLVSGGYTFKPDFGPASYQVAVTSGPGPRTDAPDVSIMTLNDSGGNYLPGDTITGGGLITVSGGTDAIGGYTLQIFLSQDAIFGNNDDSLLQTVPITGLTPDSTSPFQFQGIVPATTLPGNYRLIASIVPNKSDSTSESNTTNNFDVSPLNDIVVLPVPGAVPTDLFPVNLQYTPGTYHAGDAFNGSGMVTNTGPGSTAPFDVSLILSEDGVFGSRDNILLKTITDAGFAGAGTNGGSIQTTIPAGIPAGNYHVLLAVDSGNVVAETDETNNVAVSPMPDVVIPAPPVPPAPLPVKIGSPNPNFGVQGLAAHNVGITTTSDVAVQSDGKSVIVGTTVTAGSGDFALTRYTANGGLDTTFGNQGKVSTDFGGDDQAIAVTILANGKILVIGTSIRQSGGQPAGSEFALAQYNSNGTLDTSFGHGTGMVLTSFAANPQSALSNDVAHAVTVDSNGTIYVAGSSDANGTGRDFAVAAYNAAGMLQTSFGGTGKVLVDFTGGDDSANAVAIQKTKKTKQIILAGSTQDPGGATTAIGVVRLKLDGTIDKTFGKNGRITKSLRGQDDEASSVAIQSDGQIVVGGFSATGSAADGSLSSDFALVRFTATGGTSKFGHGGSVITSFGQASAITQILITPEGQIIASGKTTGSIATLVTTQLEVALARYNSDGSLDKTFSATGTAIITLQGSQAGAGRHRDIAVGATQLMQQFSALIQSAQGALAMTSGGDLLDVGTSGSDTVEASVVTSGVDLIAGIVGAIKSSAVEGKKAALSISVKNGGPDSAAGTVTLSLYVSSSTSASSGATLIQATHSAIKLKVSQNKSFKFSFAFPTTLAAGNYYLVAQLDSGTLPETNVANNTVASKVIRVTGSAAKAPAHRGR
jgi:uncharacterized delta-60 repeat protein